MTASPIDGLQEIYLNTLNLNTLEYLKLYNKAIVYLSENNRYDLTRSTWTDFYQVLDDAVSKFRTKVVVYILRARDVSHLPTKLKNFTSSYT